MDAAYNVISRLDILYYEFNIKEDFFVDFDKTPNTDEFLCF